MNRRKGRRRRRRRKSKMDNKGIKYSIIIPKATGILNLNGGETSVPPQYFQALEEQKEKEKEKEEKDKNV